MSRSFNDTVRAIVLMAQWREIQAELEYRAMVDTGDRLEYTAAVQNGLATVNEAIRRGAEAVVADVDMFDAVEEYCDTFATPEMLARETPECLGLIGRARQLGLID